MTHSRSSTAPASERGSAFLIALVVLSILTVIGLSLVLVTETEMLLGTTERVYGETSEVAEAVIATNLAKLVVTNALDGRTLYMSSSFDKNPSEEQSVNGGEEAQHIGYELRSAGLAPVLFEPLPYSSQGEGKENYEAGYLVGAFRTTRLGWPGDQLVPPENCDGVEMLSSTEYQMTGFYFGPVKSPPAQELAGTTGSIEQEENVQATVDFRGEGSDTCGDTLAEAYNAIAAGEIDNWGTNIDVEDAGRGSHLTAAAIEATSGYFR